MSLENPQAEFEKYMAENAEKPIDSTLAEKVQEEIRRGLLLEKIHAHDKRSDLPDRARATTETSDGEVIDKNIPEAIEALMTARKIFIESFRGEEIKDTTLAMLEEKIKKGEITDQGVMNAAEAMHTYMTIDPETPVHELPKLITASLLRLRIKKTN